MLRLYDYLESGNSYKVRLLLHPLGVPFERVAVDILKGESRTLAFLQRNPNGRIPLLELEDGTGLAESNAILWYLAEGSASSSATATRSPTSRSTPTATPPERGGGNSRQAH